MVNNLDEIYENQENVTFEKPKHTRNDGMLGFDRGKVKVRVGNNEYIVDALSGYREVVGKWFMTF